MSDRISSRDNQSSAALGDKPFFGGVKPVMKLAVFVWLAVCLQASLLASPSSHAPHARLRRHAGPAQSTETWVGTDPNGLGNWSDGDNWNPQTAQGGPNGNYDIVIPATGGAPQPTMDVSAAINNLEIDALQSLTISGGNQLTVNGTSILNNATLAVGSNGSGGTLSITNAVTLSGSGTVSMGSVAANIYGPGTLINQQTILGEGVIDVANLNNQGPGGVILGNANSTSPLAIGGAITNSGLIATQNFGAVSIEPETTVQNAGGTISGGSGEATLDGCTIIGGTLDRTVYSGTVASTLNGVTIAATGTYSIQSTAGIADKTFLLGTITNNGSILVTSPPGGDFAELAISGGGPATLTGTGSVNINGVGAFLDGVDTLTNMETISSTSFGNIIVNQLVNQGTVASSGGSLLTIAVPGGIINTGGTISAASGSITIAGPGAVTGGTLLDGAGTISLTDGVVLNGGVTLSGPGFVFSDSAILDGTSAPIKLQTNVSVPDNGYALLKGTIDITGTLALYASAAQAVVQIGGTVTLTGNGVFSATDNPNNLVKNLTGKDTLNFNGPIISASGTISGMSVSIGKGSIFANPGGYPLIVNPSGDNHFARTLAGHSFKNSGLLAETDPFGGIIQVIGSFSNYNSKTNTLTGGAYNLTGTFQFDNANLVTNAANLNLSGNGQILNQNGANGLLNFANNSSKGTFTVSGGQPFTTGGTFTNAGALIVAKASTLTIGGSGTSYNQTGGTTTVDGTLTVPAGGQTGITGGTLQGAGSVNGNVSVGNASGGAATFIIGDSVKKSASVSLANGYTQLATGIMDVQIGGTNPGTQYSQLTITGPISLQGTLNIKLINKFKPQVGETFTILTSPSSIAGTFATVNGTSIGNDHFAIAYNPDSVVLAVEAGH